MTIRAGLRGGNVHHDCKTSIEALGHHAKILVPTIDVMIGYGQFNLFRTKSNPPQII